jgi:hypothetical protein
MQAGPDATNSQWPLSDQWIGQLSSFYMYGRISSTCHNVLVRGIDMTRRLVPVAAAAPHSDSWPASAPRHSDRRACERMESKLNQRFCSVYSTSDGARNGQRADSDRRRPAA